MDKEVAGDTTRELDAIRDKLIRQSSSKENSSNPCSNAYLAKAQLNSVDSKLGSQEDERLVRRPSFLGAEGAHEVPVRKNPRLKDQRQHFARGSLLPEGL